MKKLFYIPVALLAIVACQKNELVIEEAGDEPVWRYVTASMDNDATKAILVNDGEGGKDFQWTVGDVIAICVNKKNDETYDCVTRPGEITSVEDGIAVIKYNAKGAYSIVNAWYPYSVQNSTTGIPSAPSTVAANQVYKNGAVSVPLKATNAFPISVADEDRIRETSAKDTPIDGLTFAEATTDYAVLEFPATQIAYILGSEFNRATYLPKSTGIKKIKLQIEGGSTYTLDTSEDPVVDLKTKHADVSDAAGRVSVNKSYVLVIPPLSNDNITVTYTTEDDVEFSNKKNSLTIATKHYRKMPTFDLTGYHFWRFGSSYTNSDCNGMVYWMRDIKGDGTHMTLSNGTDTETSAGTQYLDVDAGTTYMTIYPFKITGDKPYVYDFSPLWNTGHFCSDGVNQLTFNTSEKTAKMTFAKKYPILAIAVDRPKALANFSSNEFTFDTSDFTSRTIYNESGDKVTDDKHVGKALIYSKMADDGKILSSVDIADAGRVKIKLRVAFTSDPSSISDVPLKVYWAGTFRSTTEAETFFKNYVFE